MTPILISQQSNIGAHQEHHDCLDQRWHQFLALANIVAIPVPNQPNCLKSLWTLVKPQGVILSGGGEFSSELTDLRSQTENKLVDLASKQQLPILGVCRGMQVLLQLTGHHLSPISGHISPSQAISINQQKVRVNSYHNFGFKQVKPEFEVWATSSDGVVKAIQHKQFKQLGIMWHPERDHPFNPRNVQLLRHYFSQQEYPCAHLF